MEDQQPANISLPSQLAVRRTDTVAGTVMTVRENIFFKEILNFQFCRKTYNFFILAPPVQDSGRPSEIFSPEPAAPAQVFTTKGLYRSDGKCGVSYPLEDGTQAECDPNSEYWCCSEHGFCGGTEVWRTA